MSLQNRVDPYGAIVRSPARGTFMGNRGGALHNEQREIVRSHKGRRWITCVLEFRGRKRTVMSPGRYTELFFLDEAVAFAAGHRPCAECRHARFVDFRNAWEGHPRADQMDEELHRARIDRRGNKVTYEADLNSLPDGTFVRIDDLAYLVWGDRLLLWTPHGYARQERRTDTVVTVLTPRPAVDCFRAGYQPELHFSAREL